MGGSYQGEIEISGLVRLSEFLLSDQAKIIVEFSFSQSDYDTPMMAGHMRAGVTVQCQRCLKAMEIPLEMDFYLLIDAADDIVADSSLDSVYSENGSVDIFEVVEDELILGLPLVTMHDDTACNEFWQAQEDSPEQAIKENPFSVLAKLKTIN